MGDRLKLEALGLRVFLDELEIPPGRNWGQALDEALEKSRFLVLVLTPRTVGRAWVTQEWTAFMARHGPLGHIIPIMLETVGVSPILGSIQYLNALDQDAERVARELAAIVGPGALVPEPAEVFSLVVNVSAPEGSVRQFAWSRSRWRSCSQGRTEPAFPPSDRVLLAVIREASSQEPEGEPTWQRKRARNRLDRLLEYRSL